MLQPQYDARINRAREEKIPFADEQTRVRVYTPNGSPPFPGHLYIHGGAFWLLHAHHFDKVCQDVAARAQCVVVSVDYGLAPEVRWPTQVKQCYATQPQLSLLRVHIFCARGVAVS